MTKLKLLRLSKGLKGAVAAEKIGINPQTLFQLENGWYARCGAKTLQKLQQFYGQQWGWDNFMEQVSEPIVKDAR